ncbi:addiction module protein [Luteolibacter flavescens]|uniref:Addiction module protein n=1 Tax=Luteolibacter flavescens TaxID=1859460 RepID=A0ABT3FU28_9BACT|nr:addiction module protein [Luteolibacter flavescens]MCW1887090.1 addiction module protein [Luteolibacter flavescens]
MASTLELLEKEALLLPDDQKVTLAHRILASAEPQPEPSIEALWEAEILRRIDRLDRGETTTHAASEVFRELDQRFGS